MEEAKETHIKEIRLFGDKSVREEAYRNKILQLERELHRLEAIAKAPNYPEQKKEKLPERSEGAYHDGLINFEKRAKRESEFFERRANEITERLNLQAERLSLNIDSKINHKLRWVVVFALAVPSLLVVLFFVAFFMLRNNPAAPYIIIDKFQEPNRATNADTSGYRQSYIKRALQTQTKYHHLYIVKDVDRLEDIYIVEIELGSRPPNKWFLKDVCSELVSVFKRYAGNPEAEFYFTYKEKLYMKAFLTESSPRVRLQYHY